ncbi:hypothetical protein GTQ99_15070 [Kineococcus sp. T13]|uniref:iron uptake system protein EfeO n=1 Tax=Kineococcus vitellinus TaxID=2696565 RepID=UPI001411BE80|nr:iron uptake system protein EfeO [Kineococcus vitellinus]NAZ76732.1 hypothetical protein [Kineococcus vitellinus]
MSARSLSAVLVSGLLTTVVTAPGAAAAGAPPSAPERAAVATGYGGAVASVDPEATEVGLDVLRRGGNAVDAAVATAAALGVTEPYSAGVGGGGFLVSYDATTGEVRTLDGREEAPASLADDSFLAPDGTARPFPELVSSTLSVGVPGTPATWQRALAESGTMTLAEALSGARSLAERGFVVDQEFHDQTVENAERFRDFSSTAQLFLPGGDAPAVGSVFTNPDLARTYQVLAEQGAGAFYGGELGRAVVDTVAAPPVADGVTREVLRGGMVLDDLLAYRALERVPTRVVHDAPAAGGPVEVYGMAPPSSGGSTVGEALQVIDAVADQRGPAADDVQLEHRKLEAAALAFADRNRWVGDPDVQDVPLHRLLSPGFAASRACLVEDAAVLPRPVAAGDGAACGAGAGAAEQPAEGPSTTHLVTADASGDVVSYTLTIEQTGGSGVVVPGRGFLLNNELTDFSTGPAVAGVVDPNRPGPGKRPRSSMSPTIVLRDGRPLLATGSPGGATIIGTTLGILVDRLDRGRSLPEAVAAPRVSEQNGPAASAEQAYVDSPTGQALAALGHVFTPVEEIGAAAALEVLPDGRVQAVAEPRRRGGGAAGGTVHVSITDDGCTAEPTSVPAGAATFEVVNDGATAVTEAELVNAGGRIVGERENLTPGLSASFSLQLEAGEYTLQCPNAASETSPFTVTGAAAATAGTEDPLFAAATQGYQDYVKAQVADLVTATDAFAAAVQAGDVERAKALYGPARVPWERVETVAESFGDLDPRVDARLADVADPATWTGFHRIEQALFERGSTAGAAPVAQQLVADVAELHTLVQTTTYQPADLANGSSGLLDEVASSKVTGEEEAYSHLDLLDFAANVEGARRAFDLLTPALQVTDPELVTTITQRFDDVDAALAPHRQGDSYVLYTTLSQDQVRDLASAVDALAEPLSLVSGKVVGAAQR